MDRGNCYKKASIHFFAWSCRKRVIEDLKKISLKKFKKFYILVRFSKTKSPIEKLEKQCALYIYVISMYLEKEKIWENVIAPGDRGGQLA